MTVQLLFPYATYGTGATADFDNATEAALVVQKRAVYVGANPGDAYMPLTPTAVQGLGEVASVPFTPLYAGALRAAAARPVLCGQMGDSIVSNGLDFIAGTQKYYRGRGWLYWAMVRMGWPLLPVHGLNVAVSGTTSDIIRRDQLPALLALHAVTPMGYCAISMGTNDANAARSFASVMADWDYIFGALNDAGIIPIHIGVLPRGADGSVSTLKRSIAALNNNLQTRAMKGQIWLPPLLSSVADVSNNFGNIVTGLTDGDNLHPWDNGAYYLGADLATYLAGKGLTKNLSLFPDVGSDVFNASDNPTGSLYNSPNPLFTGGGASGPTGMTVAGGTWSANTRTLGNGQVRNTADCALVASTDHNLYDDMTTGGLVVAGEALVATSEVVITSGVNLTQIFLEASVNDGSARVFGCLKGSGGAVTLPAIPGPTTFYLMTPPWVMAGTAATAFTKMHAITGAGASGTLSVRSMDLRKWLGPV